MKGLTTLLLTVWSCTFVTATLNEFRFSNNITQSTQERCEVTEKKVSRLEAEVTLLSRHVKDLNQKDKMPYLVVQMYKSEDSIQTALNNQQWLSQLSPEQQSLYQKVTKLKRKYGNAAILHSINMNIAVFELLVLSGADVTEEFDGENVLHRAAQLGNIDIIKWLISDDVVNINSTNKHGNNVLHIALDKGDIKLIQYLLEHTDINVDRKDKRGNTVLFMAVKRNNPEVVEMLINSGRVKVNTVNSDRNTALHVAAIHGNFLSIVKFLVNKGYGEIINAKNNNGDTVLHLSVRKEYSDMTAFLLTVPGIDVSIKNKRGVTAMSNEETTQAYF